MTSLFQFPACEQCSKTFATEREVKNHQINVHPKKIFKCHHCNHVSKTKAHLKYHMEVHSNTRNRVERFSCPMCSHRACNRASMQRHYVEVHDVSLTPEKHEFKDYEEFLSWKSDLQRKEHCSYVTNNGARKASNKVIHKFKCFRDGFCRSLGKGKRRAKLGGSDKINGICPSAITASVDRHSGVVAVSYVVSHVGHDTDVGRLHLPKDEREAIARKIAAKVPFDVILGEYKDSRNCQLDRANLVTRKDLWNIARDYHLNVSGINPNDSASVLSRMNRIEKSNIDSNLTEEKRPKTGETAEHSATQIATSQNNSSLKKDKNEIYRIHAASRKDGHHDKLNGSIMHRNDANNDGKQVHQVQSILPITHRNDARIRDDMRVKENAQQAKTESSDDKFRRLVETMLAMTIRHPGQLSSTVMSDAEKLFQKMRAISDDLEAQLLFSVRTPTKGMCP